MRPLKDDATEATEKGIQFGGQQRNWIIKDTRYYGNDLPWSVQKMEEERAHEIVHMLTSLVRAGNEVHFHTPVTAAMMAFIEV